MIALGKKNRARKGAQLMCDQCWEKQGGAKSDGRA